MDKLKIGDARISFRLVKKLGAGSFGDVYLAVNIETGEKVAVKMERSDSDDPQLFDENKLYSRLVGGVGIPRIKWFGQVREYNCLVMDLLGPSLEDLFKYCEYRFSMKTTLMLVVQMIDRFEFIHSRDYIHRDIKPENMMMGTGMHCNDLYIIDFGLSKRFRRNGQHIPYCDGKGLTGTARYASLNAHKGREQGRRDDMEALGYVFAFFLQGSLPWMGLKAHTQSEKYAKITKKKKNTPADILYRGCPAEFTMYMNYCLSLGFDEKPDYPFLKGLFTSLFRSLGYLWDDVYDWTVSSTQRKSG